MKSLLPYAALAGLFFACSTGSGTSEQTTVMEEPSNRKNEWISLFDGETTEGWHTYGKEGIGSAWKVEDGALYLDASQKEDWQVVGGGDIVTDQEFEDFHLKLDWKISKAGNSGIMFYVHEDTSQYEYPWQTGPEMQVLDNERHPDGQIYKHQAGDLYDLIAASEDAAKPVGEWNEVEIISQDSTLHLFLNGVTIVSTTLWDESWRELIANSKFSEYPGFGTYKKGKIALQDHGDDVWFRNIRIKKL